MIDEKRLDELQDVETQFKPGFGIKSWSEIDEILRLARLGLWAEKYGIPAISFYSENMRKIHTSCFEWDDYGKRGDTALAALPKGSGCSGDRVGADNGKTKE